MEARPDLVVAPEDRYRALIESLPAVVYVCAWDLEATLRYISPPVERMLGFPAQAFLDDQELWDSRLHPEDAQRVLADIRRCFAAGVPFAGEYRVVHADGHVVHVAEQEVLLRDTTGRVVASQGLVTDVTERKRTEDALRSSQAITSSIVAAMEEGVIAVDAAGMLLTANASALRMLQGPVEASYEDGRPVSETDNPSAHVRRTGRPVREVVVRMLREGVPATWLSVNGQPLTGGGAVVSMTDITARREAARQVAHLAYHDALTGLPNRALLTEHLELAIARAERHHRSVAVLYLDLDDFKLVNDSLGHAAGDQLLRAIADRLRHVTRATDLLCRQGGDEFLLLLTDLPGDARHAAETVADQVARALGEPFRIGTTELYAGASIGIALYPDDAADSQTLLKHADAAMYQVKGAGRGGHAIYRATVNDPFERLSLVSRLRGALKRDEFELHWQPIITLASGEVSGVEALLRWRMPDRRLLLPAEFIPLAEDSGLIESIGEWVVSELCRQAVEWSGRGLRPVLGFNVSPRQLRDPRFPILVAGKLRRANVPADRVVVEVTESATMGAGTEVEPALRELARHGIGLAIDDFGAGHSSLARLRELPVRTLKIDRSFLRAVPGDPTASALYRAILSVADALGVGVVAEGVETPAQWRFVAEAGCRWGQGFALGRPVPAAKAEALLRSSPPWRAASA